MRILLICLFLAGCATTGPEQYCIKYNWSQEECQRFLSTFDTPSAYYMPPSKPEVRIYEADPYGNILHNKPQKVIK
jgi:hypothetical protein